MKNTKENYIRPEVKTIEVETENVLCGSPIAGEENISDITYEEGWGSVWSEQ